MTITHLIESYEAGTITLDQLEAGLRTVKDQDDVKILRIAINSIKLFSITHKTASIILDSEELTNYLEAV